MALFLGFQGSYTLVGDNRMVLAVIDQHIEATADRCTGRPRIKGTRIRVQDIVALHEFHGMSADEVVDGYPHITLADVYAALAYCHDHREEIHQAYAEDEKLVEEFKRRQAAGVGKDANSVSS